MQATVRVQKTEYQRLKNIAKRYELLRKAFTGTFFEEPSTSSRKSVMKSFKETGRYNEAFLKSLEAGLRDSSFFS